MKLPFSPFLSPVAFGLLLAGCGRPEVEPSAPAEGQGEEAAAEIVEIVEPATVFGGAPSAVLIESKVEPVSADSLPGRYRDPDAPEVVYSFGADNSWEAVWQPADDETRGLMMSGVYMVEDGDLVHLRVLSLGRRESFLGDDWDRRTPPHPRPRGYFRMEGKELVIVSDRTAQAFTMAPFRSSRLVKIAD